MSTDYRYAAMMRDVGEIMAQDAKQDLRFTKYFLKRRDAEAQAQHLAATEGVRATVVPNAQYGFEVKIANDAEAAALKPKLVPVPKVGPGGDVAIPPPKDPALRAEWEAAKKKREAAGQGKYVGDAEMSYWNVTVRYKRADGTTVTLPVSVRAFSDGDAKKQAVLEVPNSVAINARRTGPAD